MEPFFGKYCLSCHDADTAKGDLNLEGRTRTIANTTDAAHWQDILDKLNAGEMPPPKKKQPSREELAKAVGDLTVSLQSAQKMLRDSGGAIVVRRLNRREYQATIKELMGVRINGEKLPDDSSGRFDTIGQNQSLNALQLENYFSFAQEVVRMALHWAVQPRTESRAVRRNAANSVKKEKKIFDILEKVRIVHETDKPFTEVGLSEYEWNRYNRGSEKYPRHAEYRDRRNLAGYYKDNLDYHSKGRMLPIRNLVNSIGLPFPHDARAHYRLRVQAGVVDGVNIRRVIRVTIPTGRGLGGPNGKPIGSFLVTGTIDKPSTHEMVWRPDFPPSFRPKTNKQSRRNVTFLEDQRGGPGRAQLFQHFRPFEPGTPDETILVKWLEAEGPFYDPKTLFERLVDTHKVATATDAELDEIAAEFLRSFANGAFRGHGVSNEFIERLHAYYKSSRAEGQKFYEAIIEPLAMILASSRFLYLVEPTIDRELDAVSLTNRLAYFLWSGPPDAELLRLANDNSLLRSTVLTQQVDRMLKSPRAEHFFEGFMSQWMHLKRFDASGLNSRLLLHRTDGMVISSRREPIEFFKTLVRENLSTSNLIDSEFVTINGLLAMNYGLTEHHSGDGFKKVSLPGDSPRGGLITQAAFLSTGTMGNRTSPVIRGALVKEILLNDPPPPPPPNVPELVAAGTDPLASVRSLVALHQKKPQCASCHARFDFIGLGLENFDAVGLWRDEELVTDAQVAVQIPRRPKKVYPIDASGELPNGETFKDVFGLKKALMKEKRKVAASLFEGLLCYALGRNISFTDRPLIQKTLNELDGEDFPVREMIKRVVISRQFRQR
ncbi:MAG: DUF1592 domain-containing protein [Planctomycetota bacterium]|nr:DUF1592 domain-containing protein [Planctomycetota bacterium]MDP6502287.1 DUF1592 domain-containing protein [Planctomycetota bacterium]